MRLNYLKMSLWSGLLFSLALSGCGISDDSRNNLKRDLQHCLDDMAERRSNVDDPILAQVGYAQIRKSYFVNSFQQLPLKEQNRYAAQKNRDEFISRLINKKVWVIAAQRAGVDRDPTYQAIFSINNDNILTDLYRRDYLKHDLAVSEEDIETLYKTHPTAFMPRIEIRATRISAKTLQDAYHVQDLLKARPRETVAQMDSKVPIKTQISTFTIVGSPKNDIEKTLLSMKVGRVSRIISSSNEFLIFKKEAQINSPGKSLEESREAIRTYLTRQKAADLLQKIKGTLPITIHKDALSSISWPTSKSSDRAKSSE